MKFLVVGTQHLPDDFPYVHTNNEQQAKKWLQYAQLKYPKYTWRIKHQVTKTRQRGG